MDPDQMESASLFAVSSIEGVLEIPDESDSDTGRVMQDVGVGDVRLYSTFGWFVYKRGAWGITIHDNSYSLLTVYHTMI